MVTIVLWKCSYLVTPNLVNKNLKIFILEKSSGKLHFSATLPNREIQSILY